MDWEELALSTDAHGHEHKEKGEGGGQFTSHGGGKGMGEKSTSHAQIIATAQAKADEIASTQPAAVIYDKGSRDIGNFGLKYSEDAEGLIDNLTKKNERLIDRCVNSEGNVRTFDASEVVSAQHYVNVDKVKELITRKHPDTLTAMPIVIQDPETGEHILYDGNHRVAAGMLLGQSTFKAHFVQLQ